MEQAEKLTHLQDVRKKDTLEKVNLQDTFLNALRKQKIVVTVFLVNGVKLQGIVTSFDNFSILLKRDYTIQLVYKHAVSTVMPMNPLSWSEESEGV